ncbi:MAG: hypothetical protein ABIK68_06475 [bacterium]
MNRQNRQGGLRFYLKDSNTMLDMGRRTDQIRSELCFNRKGGIMAITRS